MARIDNAQRVWAVVAWRVGGGRTADHYVSGGATDGNWENQLTADIFVRTTLQRASLPPFIHSSGPRMT